MATNKDFKPIITELQVQGWTVEKTGQGHFKAVPPVGGLPIVHFSGSYDRHAIKNTLHDLKKSGFQWPPPSKKEVAASRESSPSMTDEFEDFLGEEDSTPTPTQPAGPAESQEQRMDRLWTDLKEAKGYLTLADEHLDETRRQLEAAQRAYDEAQVERDKAAEKLRATKATFDEAFSAAA